MEMLSQEHIELICRTIRLFTRKLHGYIFTNDYLNRIVTLLETEPENGCVSLFDLYAELIQECGNDYKKVMELIIAFKFIGLFYSEIYMPDMIEPMTDKNELILSYLHHKNEVVIECEEHLEKTTHYFFGMFDENDDAMNYYQKYC